MTRIRKRTGKYHNLILKMRTFKQSFEWRMGRGRGRSVCESGVNYERINNYNPQEAKYLPKYSHKI
jgi:hypothetical protein